MSAETITLATLYEGEWGSGKPVIQVNGSGAINIYGSYVAPASSPVTNDMALLALNGSTNVTGIVKLEDVPPYIYVTESTATVDSVYITGVKLTAV